MNWKCVEDAEMKIDALNSCAIGIVPNIRNQVGIMCEGNILLILLWLFNIDLWNYGTDIMLF